MTILEGEVTTRTFDRHLSDRDETHAVLDLTDAGFTDAAGLVLLACEADRIARLPSSSVAWPPRRPNIRSYYEYVGVTSTVESIFGTTLERATSPPQTYSTRTFPLQRFSLDENFQEQWLGKVLEQALAGHRYSQDVVNAMWVSSVELASNAQFHSRASSVYMAATVQARPRKSTDLLQLAVADAGIGVASALRGVYGDLDDAAALDLAVQPGVSSRGELAGGLGLPTLVESVTALDGRVTIRSGCGRLNAHGADTATSTQVGTLYGTAVIVKLEVPQ